MKNRTDKILLAVFAVSLALYILIPLIFFDIIPVEYTQELHLLLVWAALILHAVPVFCLQLLLCRRKRRWVAAIPAVIVIGAALCFTYEFFHSFGWDTLGWGILLLLTIAPAAGCALGWAAYGLRRLYRRGDSRG